ncbi:6966_t:CDS:2 [Ambispora leptoticha]|uniref:6966_t:CDS:1 n=1 Tax=Ambispora leptoticha TaxID=144679 RepID=A0A9N8V7N5_9GLOM|nr:6966_t:CDS:2 [Ambispora leptoticha]
MFRERNFIVSASKKFIDEFGEEIFIMEHALPDLYQQADAYFGKEDKRKQIPLQVPSSFNYNKEYRAETVDEKYGYNFYFKEGESKMFGKEPHVHIRGHGREIQYFLSPFRLKKKIPKNFPQGEESKLKKHESSSELKRVKVGEFCFHPNLLKLEVNKEELTAFLSDGRKTNAHVGVEVFIEGPERICADCH